MPNEQQQTSFSNQYFDLVSVLYHSLESAQTNSTYIRDAQQSGDQELAQFFQQVQQEDNRRAERAKQLLEKQMSRSGSR